MEASNITAHRHWRQISNDPNCAEVKKFLADRLSAAYAGTLRDALVFTADFVRRQDVLDIGVVAHTIERTAAPDWKHGVIKRSARSVVGIDILEEPVKVLRSQGYDIRLIDATSDHDLGMRFSRIVIGDVIEHVNNPVSLLRFARRHLHPGGKILCSTPNPVFVGNILVGFKDGWFLPNADHMGWITPTMALEIGHRAGVSLSEIWHLRGAGITTFKRGIVKLIETAGLGEKELFVSSFYYVFE
jgi:2-polyprenyl-3-methyl-5-hydroxy-6-metoxy-1,4-benzoquinol methylase